ncbi:hypothetical protein [Egbenema bharatensis]
MTVISAEDLFNQGLIKAQRDAQGAIGRLSEAIQQQPDFAHDGDNPGSN